MKTRREFLEDSMRILTSGIVGCGLIGRVGVASYASSKNDYKSDYKNRDKALAGKDAIGDMSESEKSSFPYRVLGRTGLKISVISFGTIHTESSVIRYGISRGINFIHTSLGYSGGRSIREVAKAIRGIRDKVYLGLKVTWNWKRDDTLKKALDILGTEYVDILFFNIHNNPKLVESPEVKSAFDRWKKKGMVRFMGLTTHSGMRQCMESALKTGWYDCLMPTYTLNMWDDYKEIFERCKQEKIGFVAMKTGVSPTQPELVRSILKEEAITTICRTISSLSDVNGFATAAEGQITSREYRRLIRQAELMFSGRCRMCGNCTVSCPEGVAVGEIVRCVNYYLDEMRLPDVALQTFSEIRGRENLARCNSCGICERLCPVGLPVLNYISRAKRVFC